MSFEPLHPVGFSPCGMAMGVLRPPCYSAPAKFFADGGPPNRIVWYFVPDNRPFYEGWHAFSPRRDDMDQASGFEPELTGRKPNPRAYYSGRDQWEREGLHVHGDQSDFLGRSLTEKYFQPGVTSHEPCGTPHIHFNLFMLGNLFEPHATPVELFTIRLALGTMVEPSTVEEFPAGMALGTIVEPSTVELFAAGFELGTIVIDPEWETFKEGMAVGTIVEAVPLTPEELAAGLVVGTIVEAIADPVEELAAGLVVGTIVEAVPLTPEELAAGLVVGTIVEAVPLTPEELAAGLMLGNLVESHSHPPDYTPFEVFYNGLRVGTIRDDMDTPEELSDGLALGDLVEDVIDVVVPGLDCDSAAEIAFDLDYTFDISSPTNHWFKFAATAATQYHVKLVVNSGSGANATVNTGSCAGPTMQFILNPPFTTCNTHTPGSDTTVMIMIAGGLFGSTNYTLSAGVGACP